jgi:hypothetical protein
MNQGAVLHKGLLSECKVCNSTTKTQEKRTRRARSKTGVSLDVVIRRQVAFDLGEDEPQKDERFQLLQKYGVAIPRIDRLMTKPNWMGVAEFKRKLNDWYKLTKGMIQPQQQRREYRGPNVPGVRPSGPRQRFVQPLGVLAHALLFRSQRQTQESLRDNRGGQGRPSQGSGRDVRSVPKENRSFGDRP